MMGPVCSIGSVLRLDLTALGNPIILIFNRDAISRKQAPLSGVKEGQSKISFIPMFNVKDVPLLHRSPESGIAKLGRRDKSDELSLGGVKSLRIEPGAFPGSFLNPTPILVFPP